jgi:hypothetical protein
MHKENDTSISSMSFDEQPRGRARGRGRRLADEMPASVGKNIDKDQVPSTSSGRASQYKSRTREPSSMVGRNSRSKGILNLYFVLLPNNNVHWILLFG